MRLRACVRAKGGHFDLTFNTSVRQTADVDELIFWSLSDDVSNRQLNVVQSNVVASWRFFFTTGALSLQSHRLHEGHLSYLRHFKTRYHAKMAYVHYDTLIDKSKIYVGFNFECGNRVERLFKITASHLR